MKNYCKQIKADNFNDLFLQSIWDIKNSGVWVKPRGMNVKELIGTQLILTDPKKCLITIKDRKLNYIYLTIEKMMYLSKFQDPKIIIAYNQQMRNYLNENGTFDGAYGDRVAKNNQLEWCYTELVKDPSSRRAVVTINDYTDRNHETKDAACTLSWQFLIRNNKLDMIVCMRSQDLLWGASLDFPAFCFIQEVMAYWLGIEVGVYIHNDASLHYYEEFEDKLLSLLKEEKQFIDYDKIQNFNEVNDEIIPNWNIGFNETADALKCFWASEQEIREKRVFNTTKYETINIYLQQILKYWLQKDAK